MSDHYWLVCHTKPRCEKKFAALMKAEQFEHYLALIQSVRRYAQQTKKFTKPLFPGYVFCRFDVDRRLRVVTSPNITSIVGVGKKPFPVADEEIQAIQTMVASGLPLEPWKYLEVGQRVRIEGGSLEGLTGILVQEKNSLRVVVNVNLLRRSVAVEISRERLVAERPAWRSTVMATL